MRKLDEDDDDVSSVGSCHFAKELVDVAINNDEVTDDNDEDGYTSASFEDVTWLQTVRMKSSPAWSSLPHNTLADGCLAQSLSRHQLQGGK